MPLVGFRPTKARLVMENARPSVLVLKVSLDDAAVGLATGGSLGELTGVLRIRERRVDAHGNGHTNGNGGSNGGNRDDGEREPRGPIGSLTYVPATDDGADTVPAKFQIEVTMAADRFAELLRAANAGRMPTRFMIDAGGASGKGIGYRVRAGIREKLWDNVAFRILSVTHFVMILPLDLAVESVVPPSIGVDPPIVSAATNAQVAELMDDMLTFQSDTRNTMFGLVCVLGIVALAALALGVATVFR